MRFAHWILVCLTVSDVALGAGARSDLPGAPRLVEGIKRPSADDEAGDPVRSWAWTAEAETLGGFNELLPFILRSPDQEDAGTCLYMAHTGIAEWWLARLNPTLSRKPNGPLDLSERHLMNLAGLEDDSFNWRTDTIQVFNKAGHGVLNSRYRFTKGWYTTDADGNYVRAAQGAAGASYGAPFNWVDDLGQITGGKVNLPRFDRQVIYADPNGDQWAVGGMPGDIVDRVKTALKTRKAPVLVIYNHFSYWHAVYVVGYDDEAASGGCQFVQKSRAHFKDTYARLRSEYDAATSVEEKERIRKRMDKTRRIWEDLEKAWANGGGCSGKGMLYVRDSIYPDKTGPTYDYDPGRTGEEAPYSMPVVLHEYEWLRYLGNHAVQIGVAQQ